MPRIPTFHMQIPSLRLPIKSQSASRCNSQFIPPLSQFLTLEEPYQTSPRECKGDSATLLQLHSTVSFCWCWTWTLSTGRISRRRRAVALYGSLHRRGRASIKPYDVKGKMVRPSSRFWMLITREGMWKQFHAAGRWAFHRISTPQAHKLRGGEVCVVYLTRENESTPGRIVAAIRVTSPGRSVLAQGTVADFYPFRVPFCTIAEFNPLLSFQELVPSLGFITRKGRYGIFLQGQSAIALSEEDGVAIIHAARAQTSRGVSSLRRLARATEPAES